MATTFINYVRGPYEFLYGRCIPAQIYNASPSNFNIPKRLLIDCRKDIIEVPCMVLEPFIYTISFPDSNLKYTDNLENIKNVVLEMPLVVPKLNTTGIYQYQTAATILKTFFEKNLRGTVFKALKCKDVLYYGNKGYVAYKDGTPLAMFTLRFKKCYRNDVFTKLLPVKPVFRINPIIFSRDDSLAKYLRNTFVNKLLELNNICDITCGCRYSSTKITDVGIDEDNMSFSVIIENFDDMFTTTPVPTINCTNESINKFLNDNLEDFTENLWR